MELRTHLKKIATERWAKIPPKKRSEIMKKVRKGKPTSRKRVGNKGRTLTTN